MSMLKVTGIAAAAAFIAVVVMNYADLKRYIKIEKM